MIYYLQNAFSKENVLRDITLISYGKCSDVDILSFQYTINVSNGIPFRCCLYKGEILVETVEITIGVSLQ